MGKYTFPEKPQHTFTKNELEQRQEILNKKIEHIKYENLKYIAPLIDSFSKSSFQARKLGEGAKLYKKELEKETTIIWSLAGSIFSAGLRELVIESI